MRNSYIKEKDVSCLARDKEWVSIETSLYHYEECRSLKIKNKISNLRTKSILENLLFWFLYIILYLIYASKINELGFRYSKIILISSLIICSFILLTPVVRSIRELFYILKQPLLFRKIEIKSTKSISQDFVMVYTTSSIDGEEDTFYLHKNFVTGEEDTFYLPKDFVTGDKDIYIVLSKQYLYAVTLKKGELL